MKARTQHTDAGPRKGKSSTRRCSLVGMHSLLNLCRFCLYAAVMAWTLIVLAIAAHFEQMIISSELTRFVPLSIFISAVTLLVLTALLLAPVTLRHNPVSTRVELACLALLSAFWLSLGAYTASADMGDLECFGDEEETEPVEVPGFSNDTYHSQYRALEGFALINVFLLLSFLLFMLVLAVRQHIKGYRTVWLTPMPLYPWFTRRSRQRPSKLPPPVTSRMKSAGAPVTTRAAQAPPFGPVRPAVAPTRMPPPPAPVRTQSQPAPKPPAKPSAPAAVQTRAPPAPRMPPRAQTQPAPAKASTKQYPNQYQRAPTGTVGGKMYSVYIPPIAPQPAARAAPAGASGAARPSQRAPPPRRK